MKDRRPLVVGNWKMHLDGAGAERLAGEIRDGLPPGASVDVGVCPPFPYLCRVSPVLKGSAVALGAQDGHWEQQGPFTGWVSMAMLVDVGCSSVIIGHSERRQFGRETDDEIGRKVRAGLDQGLGVILCVGETGPERDAGVTEAIVARQLSGALEGLASRGIRGLVVAYEPVWAIGTGKTATPALAQEAHQFIRQWILGRLGSDVAQQVRILYGGSVKPDNMRALAEMPDIDGALVGGASLQASGFLDIVRQAAAGKG
ncbi:MAG: triose-phosphate isomerase [Candidatus Eisenbacteria bacterium]|jgi:triosephosphate isomerase|nr:triose-phosphate isomerase [Candidatus Eisenbacteria bacterium]